MYLEISPRATGKTYRLIQHAHKFLTSSVDSKVNIHCRHIRQATFIHDKLIELGHRKERIKLNLTTEPGNQNYFDDFDYNPQYISPYFIDLNGYYCTSIAKKRKLGKEDETDFLLNLIKANSGQYTSYYFTYEQQSRMLDKIRVSLEKDALKKDAFEREFLNQLFE